MDKNAIKKYAVWARRELIDRVTKRAAVYGISKDNSGDYNAESVNGHLLSGTEKRQRQALIRRIEEKGYEQVMEEVAYTWFNRFAALRFMEVNGYLPSHIRTFTDDEDRFRPQILAEAIHLELDGLNMEKVYQLKDANQEEELFKYLLIVQCNALNNILPIMFQKIDDYTELLLPDLLLRNGSIIEQMVKLIPEDSWKDQVQILGWLYQYYIAEPKDVLINAHKKYKKDEIPFVTQLFTPDWIVRYMVDNSLGRLWIEEHPESKLKKELKYYLDSSNLANFPIDTEAPIRGISPEELRIIDPCQGSGHILAYLFDLLVIIYAEYGYSEREAVEKIVNNNLWGLDIDERATQLSYFSIMMKARKYDRRFFTRGLQPHIYTIVDSKSIDPFVIDYFIDGRENLKSSMDILIRELSNAKEIGSIIEIPSIDFPSLFARLDELQNSDSTLLSQQAHSELLPFFQTAFALSKQYNVIVTNPPYMNSSYMPTGLKDYIQKYYPNYKGDLFASFAKHSIDMCTPGGHVGLLMPYVWMFISSYEEMRYWINKNALITSLVQLEYNAFEAACVPVAAITFKKDNPVCKGEYVKLSEFKGADNQEPKLLYAIENPQCGYRYSASQRDFSKIPGAPIAYWVGSQFVKAFEKGKLLGDLVPVKKGMDTGDNDKYLRMWFEVDWNKFDYLSHTQKWIPYDKGGDYRKWYGNNNYVLNWENNGYELEHSKANLRSKQLYFRESITWNALSSSNTCFRFSGYFGAFDSAGSSLFPSIDEIPYYLGVLNTKVAQYFLSVINPTLNYGAGSMSQVPILPDMDIQRISEIATKNIQISKADWDSFETSWDFVTHPLVGKKGLISEAFNQWEKECDRRFYSLKENEEEINRIVIEAYNLSDTLSPEIDDSFVTVNKANKTREIKSLISFAVGCVFGRYSLDYPGIAYAGGEWDETRYKTFIPDSDGIIPICDDEYFDDDIVCKFVDFIGTAYGQDVLEENLQYIASALGGSGSSREIIRNYFLNDFFADHCASYSITGSGRRPIYWLFDSGKKNGFKALIYLHRYQTDTIARIRTDYVHEMQGRYRTAIEEVTKRSGEMSTSERIRQNKRLSLLQAQAEELQKYEEKIHHLADQMISINLDNGVKENYSKFISVLAKIK